MRFMHEIEAGPRADCCLRACLGLPPATVSRARVDMEAAGGWARAPESMVAGTRVASAGPEDSGQILHRL